ncbi:MAG: saccharopine dehydrogenase NADP-binding domain-containing protein [Actinomycetota bacterium]|nr:saccharopine dehydrogenase NADP-binding domain-containing protein [Actinomycetota bacterium]MDQ3647873.1 saccharopine dehydrogenase NADP-binding domain-containing protein [Actinomycetota bacterium]
MAERELDVVVFGATSVTGRRVCAYLAERAEQAGARWAAAARDAGKAHSVLEECGVSAPETIVADVTDEASLAALASRTRVVCNLVGPYTHHGRPVIEACVAGGAHYVDLTGEIPFVRRMIDEFDSGAVAAGVKVVQVSGFEVLPVDLAVLLAAGAARERHGEALEEADLEVEVRGLPWPPRPSDVLSSGTLQSMAAVAAGDDEFDFKDPACLITDPAAAAEVRRMSPISVMPRRGRRGSVLAPMQPAAYINPAVIHRSTALREDPPLRYREGVRMPGSDAALPLRWVAAGAIAGGQAAIGGVAAAPPTLRRRLSDGLASVFPSSGFGPAPDRLEGWSWGMSVTGRGASGGEVEVEVDGQGHPGYLATARMLGEAGLLLAEPGATPNRTGCLTPAAALGVEQIARFDHARLHFTVLA